MTSFLFALLVASSQHSVKLSQDDLCTKPIVFLEARGEGAKGIAAVRRVIRNRARKSGKGTCWVVKRKGQFSSYKRGMRLSKVKIEKNFLREWEKSSTMVVLGKEYTHFYRRGSRPKWAVKLTCDKRVGNHVFCKDK